MAFFDETTNDGLCSMETEEQISFMADEDSQDSGISCDSMYSNSSQSCCSENLFVTTGPTNFTVFQMKQSPDIPSSFGDGLIGYEKEAACTLDPSWSCNLSAKPSGRRTPMKDITLSVHSRANIIPEGSPISTKSSRFDLKISRKRSIRTYINPEIEQLQKHPKKRTRPFFHRAHSTSELEIQSNYDSSPESTTKYSLAIVDGYRPSDRAFGRIESKVLAEMIESLGEEFYERYIIVDCRYPFEYDGGHIKGAINLYDPEKLRSTFYPLSEHDQLEIHSKTPIFYCEYSSVRGPNMANALRELDRQLNHSRYPYVDYQEIYVLSQGYRHFYNNANVQQHCEPPYYISMKSKTHIKELQKFSFHQKSATVGLSIRSRSTQALIKTNSPCFCGSICKCFLSQPRIRNSIGEKFSKISLKSPPNSSNLLLTPPPFCLDDSPFS